MRILIVEDDLSLANRLAEALTQYGHEILSIAASADTAIKFLASCECDAAVLDSDLCGSCSEPVGKALSRRGIPFVVVSGYSPDHLLSSLRGMPFLPKPVDQSALAYVLSSFCSPTAMPAWVYVHTKSTTRC
jgi:DNA-binding response OmpR family regulator